MFLVILFAGAFLTSCTDYSKPWFKGMAVNLVCKLPYYDTHDCYTLKVSSNGNEIETIYFNNGGYKEIDHTECSKAAPIYNFKTICTLEDLDGIEWDILPLGSTF